MIEVLAQHRLQFPVRGRDALVIDSVTRWHAVPPSRPLECVPHPATAESHPADRRPPG
jgi:hypothetical protein